jgi:hypothetical protein
MPPKKHCQQSESTERSSQVMAMTLEDRLADECFRNCDAKHSDDRDRDS